MIMIQDFSHKTVLVTGASRGIGKALAIALGQRGAQVIAIARTVGGLEEMADAIESQGGKRPLLVPLDLNDIQTLGSLGMQLNERYPRLDFVFGCASLLTKLGPLMHSPLTHLQQSLHLNVVSNMALLQTLHPLLMQSPNAQAVFLLNKIDHEPKAFWGHYAASQSALRTLMSIYDQEHEQIKVSVLEPPMTDTWLFREAYPGFEGPLNSPEQTAEWVLEQV